mgnify:CR=1 FL=1
MITIYKNTELGLTVMDEITHGCWLNIIDPDQEEIKRLAGLGLPIDYLTYPLDIDERSRVERENGEMLILLRIPIFQGQSADIPYITHPLGIILTEKYVVTVCKVDNLILAELAANSQRNSHRVRPSRLVLRLLFLTAHRYLGFLREINKQVDILEDQLQLSTRNKEVLELLKFQKSLTYFTTALKSNELMMERLQRSQLFKSHPEDEDLFEDVLVENRQAIEMTNIASNILSSMMDAFASIISNNLNTVMKFLASVTIVLSLPTMIASFYGMNVNLPLQGHPLAFVIAMALSLVISISVVFLFVKRDWL